MAGVALAATFSAASDRSEILVAKGQVAYHQGQRDDAVRLLREAVAADGRDPLAHEVLGQVLLDLGRNDEAVRAFERALAIDADRPVAKAGLARARGESGPDAAPDKVGTTVGELGRLPPVRTDRPGKRWSLNFTVGMQYDSNVTVAPRGRASLGDGDKDDVALVTSIGGEYDLVRRPDFLLRLEYDLYQTLHPDLDEFDFRAQQPRATASWGATPALWLGVQGGYNYYTLGPHTYQGEPYVMPFLSYLEGEWGLTQLIYRHGEDTYFSRDFNDIRDGSNETVNLSQTFYFPADRYVTTGYQWNTENPRRSNRDVDALSCPFPQGCPDDWELVSNQFYVGGGLPLCWGAYLDLLYLFRYDDYTEPNSFTVPKFSKTRQDDGHFIYAGVTRPITDHLAVAVTYYGSFNGSNVEEFDYRRHVVATLLQVTY